MNDTTSTIGWLIARASVGYVFLFAAWMNTRNPTSRKWTVDQTELILEFIPTPTRHNVAVVCAVAGMIMMYGGGISVVLGIEGRIGALALGIFSALGMLIHRANREQALPIAAEIAAIAPETNEKAQTLGWSAYGAHLAAGLKNIALIGMSALLILNADGPIRGPWAKPWAVSDIVGGWLKSLG